MLNLYCIFDNKSGQWQSPVADYNDATMKRGVIAGLSGADLRRFAPADFEIFDIGGFDPESGSIECRVHRYVCSVADLFEKDVITDASEK